MPRLPAACTSCGALYPSPLRAREPGADAAFEVPVPCPACGSGGRVPAEVLRRLVGLVRTLEATTPEEERLDAFLEGAEEAFRRADDREDAVLDALRVDPGLGRLAGGVPGGTPALMTAFLPLVRRLASALRADREAGGGEEGEGTVVSEIEGEPSPDPAFALVERVLSELYEERAVAREEEGEPGEVVRARARLKGAGRNDPCPCGSGDKYKDCHWVEDRRVTRGGDGGRPSDGRASDG